MYPSVPPPSPNSPPPGLTPRTSQSRFERRPEKPTLNPRRVVGGIRLQTRPAAQADAAPPLEGASVAQTISATWGWASARWMRLAEDNAPGDQLAQGFEYARAGQTRSLDTKPGLISARVQGRLAAAYRTEIRLPTFQAEDWEPITTSMAGQARYAAALLGGELPTGIEDLFVPLRLRLFPAEASDLACTCNCEAFRASAPSVVIGAEAGADAAKPARSPDAPWCKHVCCVMYLIAERLGREPLFIFSLRGLSESDLLERLRHRRALAGLNRAGGAAVPVYAQYANGIGGSSSTPGDTGANGGAGGSLSRPLEECAESFWSAGAAGAEALRDLDLPIAPPEVTHPLLRRLGPTPFAAAKFPLVGLLATCYDVISEAAIIRTASAPGPAQEPQEPPGAPSDPAP